MASHATFVPVTERDFSVAAATRFGAVVFTSIHFSIYSHTHTTMSTLVTAAEMHYHERPSSDRLSQPQFSELPSISHFDESLREQFSGLPSTSYFDELIQQQFTGMPAPSQIGFFGESLQQRYTGTPFPSQMDNLDETLLRSPCPSQMDVFDEFLRPLTSISSTSQMDSAVNLTKVCGNCGITTTSMWRHNNDGSTVCNVCSMFCDKLSSS
jgi:hypothetical protein